jgi:hypothetical protein
MAQHKISNADVLTWGAAYLPGHNSSKPGAVMSPVYYHTVGAPLTLDADGLVLAATSAELPNATTITYTFATQGGASPLDGANPTGVLDIARNLTIAVTHATSVVAMTILVTGKDLYGQVMTELLSIAATGTSQAATGAKAFKSITTIAITSAGNATTNTMNMGWGDVLGLPYYISSKNQVIHLMDGVPQTSGTVVVGITATATATTGDVRGTVTPATATNGTRTFAFWLTGLANSSPNQSAQSVFGVAQA